MIQGENDRYSTMAQVKAIESGCQCSVKSVILRACDHSPHIDQAERTLELMKEFVQELG